MYQLSTFYSESKKRNLTFKKTFKKEYYKQHLKIALKEIPITSFRLHLGKWDFHCSQKKSFKLPPKSDLCFPGDKHEVQYFMK